MRLTLIPEEGNPFSLNIQIPYIGFSLYDSEGNKVHNELEVAHDKVDEYRYEFVGDDNNDRFTLQLDDNKLVYICVLRHEDAQLVVRDQRQRLAVVDQIPSEGKLSELMMNAHSALIKNKNYRWRINIAGSSITHEVELEITQKVSLPSSRSRWQRASTLIPWDRASLPWSRSMPSSGSG